MPTKLPDEILLEISKLLGEKSTLDLKPLVLLNRQWHNVVAPILLSTVSVSSLNGLLELCDHVLSFAKRTGGILQSTMENHTKTIVIDGDLQDPLEGDCYAGLEDLEYTQRGSSIYPDTTAPHEEIVAAVNNAIPRLVALEGLEWYGRFNGDFYLTQRLLKTGAMKHLTYGVDWVSSESPGYRKNAFLFEGLKTLTIMCDCEEEPVILPYMLKMMHRNPDIEKLVFDCKDAEYLQGLWSLMDLICDKPHPQKSIFVWPKLKHLVLESFNEEFWQSAHQVDCLAQFLAAHPAIETLVLRDTCLGDSENETVFPLSLSSYPDSLPRLKVLLGAPWLISGVLESTAACSSVVSIIDGFPEGLDEGVKAPYVDRIIAALEKVPANQVQRLRLEVLQLSRDLYAKFARIAPRIRFLEFLSSKGNNTTPYDESFNPSADIPFGLLGFTQLDTIGLDIVGDFIDSTDDTPNQSLFSLAKRVPRIKYVHCGEGFMLEAVCNPDGSPGRLKEADFLDNSEYDWRSPEMSWMYRPLSRQEERIARELKIGYALDALFRYEHYLPRL